MNLHRPMRAAPRAVLVAALLALPALALPACTSTPLAPIPEPLPESLAWQAAGQSGAFLGLKTEENDSGSLDALFFKPGARVAHVIENSPASAAGFVAGDVVLALDGEAVNDPAALDALVTRRAPGTRVTLSVQRGDSVSDVPALLAAMGGAASAGSAEPRYRLDPARSRAGWATSPEGVVLASVAPDSPCTRAGLQVGTIVLALDGESVHSDRELIRRLATHAPGDTVRLTLRDGPPASLRAVAATAAASATGAAAASASASAPRDVELTLQDQPTRLTGVHIPILFAWESSPDGKRGSCSVLDFWVLSIFRYEREEHERHYTLLSVFGWNAFSVSAGEGELGP